jgi:hypothetical protein
VVISGLEMRRGAVGGDRTVVYCNGPLTPAGISDAVVFVCGDLTLRNDGSGHFHSIWNSLVICTGGIELSGVENSIVVLRGGIKSPRIDAPYQDTKSAVLSGEREPRRFIRWLEPEDFGISVAPDKSGVLITKANPNTPLSSAGVRAGDLVVAVNGWRVKSLPDVRRYLCRALVSGVGISFTVKRGDKTEYLAAAAITDQAPP